MEKSTSLDCRHERSVKGWRRKVTTFQVDTLQGRMPYCRQRQFIRVLWSYKVCVIDMGETFKFATHGLMTPQGVVSEIYLVNIKTLR